MNKQERRLSFKRILWTDYSAFYASLVPFTAWIVYLAWAPDWRGRGPVIKPEARAFFLTMILLATIAGLSVLAFRLRLLYRVFQTGAQVRGKISRIELKRDHGRVEYAYIFDHQEYFSSSTVHRNAQTRALKGGETVILVVYRSKPARAFIRDLYIRR